MKTQSGYTIVELMMVVWILVVIAGVGGWIWNIVKMVGICCEPVTGMLILRIIGIFVPPLGAVVGFL